VCYEDEKDSVPVLPICVVAEGSGLGWREVFALDDLSQYMAAAAQG